jgi:hypothetical protein
MSVPKPPQSRSDTASHFIVFSTLSWGVRHPRESIGGPLLSYCNLTHTPGPSQRWRTRYDNGDDVGGANGWELNTARPKVLLCREAPIACDPEPQLKDKNPDARSRAEG